MPKLRVGFILAPRFTLAAFANFVDAVRLAADDGDRSQQIECEWEVLGEPGEMIESSCGLHVQPWGVIESPERFDYIVVVGGLLHGKTRASSNVNVFLKSAARRSEEHTSELQSLMRNSYAVFCLKKKK